MNENILFLKFRNLVYAGNFFGALILFFFLSFAVEAQQFPSDLWHEGKIILLEGDTLKGNVKYDLQQDLVQYGVADQRTTAFSARKVLFFEIFDTSVRKYRQFFALPFTTTSGYRAPVFFELLEEGKMTLLSRESVEYRTYSSPYYMGSYSRLVLVYKYYFLDEKGNIAEFTGNKNDLLNLMNKKSEEVEKYIKANKLRFDDKYDFAKIVAYYNSLFGT
ncbi:MAG TPA: hypothetical protein VFG46_30920 [Chryseolinea sp.]|nr:hypothetical protein [Chryseolinea sp.]